MTQHPAFTLLRRTPLPALEGEYLEWVHPSGAHLIHFATPDPCRVFSASFYTPPPDDSGIAHVLEHLVLCGSKNYPSSKPFFEAQSTSPRDYMNASTTRDWTAYTLASRIDSDYWTLLELYLDACFHPLLRPESFESEAVRIENGNYQGVVYNEMCGAMAQGARVMRDLVSRALFPGSAYAFNSGGDPAALVQLRLEDLRKYHTLHYTPQNVCFYSSGDLEVGLLLERLDAVLKGVSAESASQAGIPRITTPLAPLSRLEQTHPGDSQVLLAWATSPRADSLEHFALTALSFALLGHPGAPLHQALSKLGPSLADYSGFHSETAEGVFAVGVRGNTDFEGLEATVREVLEAGIDDSLLEATLTRFELEDRDLSHGAAPYGVKRMFSALSAYHHGADPCALARLERGIQGLRALPNRPEYFQQLIREHLLENPRQTTVVMRPGPLASLPTPPQPTLEMRAAETGSQDRAALDGAAQGRAARDGAARAESLFTPPSVRKNSPMGAVQESLPELDVVLEPLNGLSVPVQRVRLHETGLSHLTLSGSLEHLAPEVLATLPLYGSLASRSRIEGQEQTLTAQLQSGGALWQFSVDTHHAPNDPVQVRAEWTLSLKVLSERLPEALELLRRWILDPQFTLHALSQSLGERLHSFETLMVAQGHNLALLQAALGVSAAPFKRDALDGWSAFERLQTWQMDTIANTGENTEENTGSLELHPLLMQSLLEQMESLHRQLWVRAGLELLVVSDLNESALRGALTPLLESLPEGVFPAVAFESSNQTPSSQTPSSWKPRSHLWTHALPVSVASGAWAFQGVPYLHPDAPALFLLARVLHERLHAQVREGGGAYGATCRTSAEQGLLVCASLRDPDVGRTLKLFQTLPALLEPLTPSDLEAARIGAARMLRPLTSWPGAARRAFIDARAGYSPQIRAQFYDAVQDTDAADLRRVAARYLHGGAGAVLASSVTLSHLPSHLPSHPPTRLPARLEDPYAALA